jgi:hypothetical protein
MWHRLWRSAVATAVIVSFLLIAVHASLLHETLSQQRDCPFCQWLHNLVQGALPAVLVVGAVLIARASAKPIPVLADKPHHLPFAARSPPSS